MLERGFNALLEVLAMKVVLPVSGGPSQHPSRADDGFLPHIVIRCLQVHAM